MRDSIWSGRRRSDRHRLLRVVDDLLRGLVADRAGGLLELARRVALAVGQRLARKRIELLFELRHAVARARPSAGESCCIWLSRAAPCWLRRSVLDARGDGLLLPDELVGAALRRLRRSAGAVAVCFCCSSRCASWMASAACARLRAAVAAVGRGLAHGVGAIPGAGAPRPPDPGAAGPAVRPRASAARAAAPPAPLRRPARAGPTPPPRPLCWLLRRALLLPRPVRAAAAPDRAAASASSSTCCDAPAAAAAAFCCSLVLIGHADRAASWKRSASSSAIC